jgi:cullin-associated NEDD8-dissociated protein 1
VSTVGYHGSVLNLGCFSDMSNQQEIFVHATNLLTAEEEEIRSAAAFAAGNIAIGNPNQFVPPIVKLVKSDPAKRLLALHALKEVC